MPNLRNMIPTFWNDYWCPQIFSVIGIIYNTKAVKNPPSGWADLWRPEVKGRIVLPEISHSIGSYIIPTSAGAGRKAGGRRRGGLRDAEEDGGSASDLGEGHRHDDELDAHRRRDDRHSLQVADLYGEGLRRARGMGLSEGGRHRVHLRHLHREGHQEPRSRRAVHQRHDGSERAALRGEDLQLRGHQQGHVVAPSAGAAGAGQVPAGSARSSYQAPPPP